VIFYTVFCLQQLLVFLVIIHRRAGGHTYFEDICEDHY